MPSRRKSKPGWPGNRWLREALAAPPAPDSDAPARPNAGLFGLTLSPRDASVVVIPVPYEATTSYGRGTSRGPAAVLRASHQVDLLDADFGRVHEHGVTMLPIPRRIADLSRMTQRAIAPVHRAGGADLEKASHRRLVDRADAAGDQVNTWVAGRARKLLAEEKVPAVLGGDHSVPYGLIAESARHHGGLGILHVDAHADLREAYEGFKWSHASIMRRVLDDLPEVTRLVQVGVRDFGDEELRHAATHRGRVALFLESEMRDAGFRGRTWDATCREIVGELPQTVHVSFDIDGLSPDLCPHAGTPVPGGLSFAETCHLLRVLMATGRRVVSFDLCEVAPGPRGDEWDANVGARVLYKLAGCAVRSR